MPQLNLEQISGGQWYIRLETVGERIEISTGVEGNPGRTSVVQVNRAEALALGHALTGLALGLGSTD